MDNVIDFINVNRERYLEELKACWRSRASARCPSMPATSSAAPTGALAK